MKQSSSTAGAIMAAMLIGLVSPIAMAQEPSPPAGYSARDEQADWINDPHMHAFYQATIEAFAQGPDRVDREAYEKRSRTIFYDLAVARNMPPENLLDHLKAIPGQMVDNVIRDPATLESYEAFVEALFGPQSFPDDAPVVGGGG